MATIDANERNYVIAHTEDLTFDVRWTDADGEPYTLTAVLMQVRDAAQELIATAQVAALDEGWQRLTLEAGTLPIGMYRYDVLLTRSDDMDKVIRFGTIRVVAGVSVDE